MEQNAPAPNPLERRLDISIAREALESATEERLKRMGRNVKIPGFRPGKVPFSVLRQQYGAGARHEALSEALQAAFGEAVTTQKLNVAGLPRIEENESENNETHLAFAAIFEVYPEFTPGDLS
ncbi:MAG: trigger factor, partial [Candidatus Accumulibacter sp.]|nr:trigger factor [Accumulibacter sp.]